MVTTKDFSPSEIEEFLQTDACKGALMTYCLGKGIFPKKRNILVSEVKIPAKTAFTVSLTTLTPFEVLIRKNEDGVVKFGQLKEPMTFSDVNLKEEDSFYNEVGERAYNCIKAAKINCLSELVQYSPAELLKFRNFGEVSLTAVMNWVHRQGLCLGISINKLRAQE